MDEAAADKDQRLPSEITAVQAVTEEIPGNFPARLRQRLRSCRFTETLQGLLFRFMDLEYLVEAGYAEHVVN